MSANIFSAKKTVLALGLALIGASAAQANVVTGTINKLTTPTVGTTVDYWAFSVSSAANIVIDVRANEGYVSGFGSPTRGFVDLNGDGEYTVADTHFHLFQDAVLADTNIASADDGTAWTPATAGGNGWADGSLNTRDSYMETALDVGNYIIAFGDYQLTVAEAVAGFNTNDNISGQTGINPFTGANGQDHFDYQLTFLATDFDTGAVIEITATQVDVNGIPLGGAGLQISSLTSSSVAPVPVPGAVWLFGTAMAAFGALGRRKQSA